MNTYWRLNFNLQFPHWYGPAKRRMQMSYHGACIAHVQRLYQIGTHLFCVDQLKMNFIV